MVYIGTQVLLADDSGNLIGNGFFVLDFFVCFCDFLPWDSSPSNHHLDPFGRIVFGTNFQALNKQTHRFPQSFTLKK